MSSAIVTVDPVSHRRMSAGALARRETAGRTVLPRTLRHPVELPAGTAQPAPRAVQIGVQLLQQARVHVKLVVDLERDVALAVDRVRELVEVVVLLCFRT